MKRLYAMPTVLTCLSLVVGLSLASTALARPRGHGYGHLTSLEHRVERLDLDGETRTAVYAVIDQARAEQRDLRRQIREAYQALRAYLEQETPDEEAVMAQAETIGALQTERRKQALRTLLAVWAQLTPEQRESLRQAKDHDGRHRGYRR